MRKVLSLVLLTLLVVFTFGCSSENGNGNTAPVVNTNRGNVNVGNANIVVQNANVVTPPANLNANMSNTNMANVNMGNRNMGNANRR